MKFGGVRVRLRGRGDGGGLGEGGASVGEGVSVPDRMFAQKARLARIADSVRFCGGVSGVGSGSML